MVLVLPVPPIGPNMKKRSEEVTIQGVGVGLGMWWAHFGALKTVGAWEASVPGSALQDVQDRDLSNGKKK